jgi:hypothetical protein
MAVATLKPAPYSPRRIAPAAMAGLTRSLERFGDVQPIVWNKRSGLVVAGHQRLKVLKSKKIKETRVVIVDLDEGDERSLNIALNSSHIAGGFTADLQALLDLIRRDAFSGPPSRAPYSSHLESEFVLLRRPTSRARHARTWQAYGLGRPILLIAITSHSQWLGGKPTPSRASRCVSKSRTC